MCKIAVKAIKEILLEIGLDIEQTLYKNVKNKRSYQVISSIGITGDLKGNLLVCTDLITAKNIVSSLSKMTNTITSEYDFGDLHKAAIGEFANQVAARTIMMFSEINTDCNITPPTTITGKNIETCLTGTTGFISSNIIGKFGNLNIYLGVKNN